jgi:hypothetical protein
MPLHANVHNSTAYIHTMYTLQWSRRVVGKAAHPRYDHHHYSKHSNKHTVGTSSSSGAGAAVAVPPAAALAAQIRMARPDRQVRKHSFSPGKVSLLLTLQSILACCMHA